MDTNSEAKVTSLYQQVQVELVEEDIPGAALHEPLDAKNVAALRWWLQHHGIELASSWRKHQLIARLVTSISLYLMCMHNFIAAIKTLPTE